MDDKSRRALATTLFLCVSAAFVAAVLVFSGAFRPGFRNATKPAEEFGAPEFSYERSSYADINGWESDDQYEAAQTFARSCARLDGLEDDARANPSEMLGADLAETSMSGTVADWRAPCVEARRLLAASFDNRADAAAAARAFFEAEFRPVRVLAVAAPLPAQRGRKAKTSKSGLITGYFEPVYMARLRPEGAFSAPALARPADLVMVDLGRHRDALAGERIAGFVADGDLQPYPDHKAINAGGLGARAKPIAWLDPDDLFFLQIQGSGRLRLGDGSELRVGYDGANGRPYTAIGRLLVERGALAREAVSMQTIRAWLDAAAPGEAQALREANESYVFFRKLDDLADPDLGPLGAEGVQLTAMRSVAVDRRYHAMGAPVWLAAAAEDGASSPIGRLFIAQDSGGAIKGPLRADIFVGAGAQAGEIAGRLKSEGEMVALVPNAAAMRLPAPSRNRQ